MAAWKRNLAIAYVAACVAELACYASLVAGSDLSTASTALLAVPFVLCAVGAAAIAFMVARACLRGSETLKADGEGLIRIEREALESTVRRAAGDVNGAKLADVSVKVASRRGVPTIDVSVKAVPVGDAPLMESAAAIQRSAKSSLETFTGREVRYVSVSFVEPRRRQDRHARRSWLKKSGETVIDTDAVVEDASDNRADS